MMFTFFVSVILCSGAVWAIDTKPTAAPIEATSNPRPPVAVSLFHYDFESVDENSDGRISREEYESNLFYIASATLSNKLFVRRDKNGDGHLDASEFQERPPAPSAQLRRRDSLAFRQLLSPTQQRNPYPKKGHSFLGEETDRDVLHVWFSKGFRSWVSPDNLVEAISMLLDRRVNIRKKDWILEQPIFHRPSGKPERQLNITVPILRYLYTHYEKDCNNDFRTLMLILLREGVSADSTTPYQAHELPLLADVTKMFPADLILVQAILATNPNLHPLRAINGSGYSYLHLFAQPLGHTVSKRLLQVGDHRNFRDSDIKTAFQELSEHPGFSGAVWLGDIYETEYKSLMLASPTFVSLVREWERETFPGYVTQSWNHHVNEEFAMCYFDLVRRNPNFDISADLSVSTPKGGQNFLHILAMNNWGVVAREFVAAVVDALVDGLKHPHLHDSNLVKLRAILKGLRDTDLFYGRTPAHLAWSLHSGVNADRVSSTFFEMEQKICVELNDCYPVANDVIEVSTDGNILVPSNSFEAQTKLWTQTRENFSFTQTNDRIARSYSTSWDGGWYTGQVSQAIQDLQNTPCAFDVYEGLPTGETLAKIIDLGRPAVFRKAAASLGIDRSHLTLASIRRRLGHFQVSTATIPHRRQHSSPYRKVSDVKTSLNEYLDGIHNTPSTAFGGPSSSAVRYLFSTQFYRQHPEILEGMQAPFDWMRQLPNTTVQRANDFDSESWPLELNAQIYIGAPGSGAPAHYHQMALNFLAFGRKLWAVTFPQDARYSVLPAQEYFSNLEERGDNQMFCIQEPGDFVLAPNWWGHATYNLNTSVGVAFEVKYEPRLYEPVKDDLDQAFAERYPQLYQGWELPDALPTLKKFHNIMKQNDQRLELSHRRSRTSKLYSSIKRG